jgi:ABC-type multidrug transport system ATPase subunit
MRSNRSPIVAEQLRKTYPGGIEAVGGIDLEVTTGEVFGLLGPTVPASPPRSGC